MMLCKLDKTKNITTVVDVSSTSIEARNKRSRDDALRDHHVFFHYFRISFRDLDWISDTETTSLT